MSGQLHVRIRYSTLIDPWFNYLIVSPDEIAEIVEGRRLGVRRLVQNETRLPSPCLESIPVREAAATDMAGAEVPCPA